MYDDDKIGFWWGLTIWVVVIVTGVIIADWGGLTDAFISWFK